MNLSERLRQTHRVLLLDGAMGTMTDPNQPSDWLNLYEPDTVAAIHRAYLQAGVDIITANTFMSQRSTLKKATPAEIERLNREGVCIARAEAARMTALTPQQPRYVVAAVGPTTTLLYKHTRQTDREQMRETIENAYREQISILLEENVDAILLETIVDAEVALAAIRAYQKADPRRTTPLMLSLAVAANTGRLLSGQTIEQFVEMVAPVQPLSIGLNCCPAASLTPLLRRLADCAPCAVSCHPNAGLPNAEGEYQDSPQTMAGQMRTWIEQQWVNIIGGCCGTTPAHIAAIRRLIASKPET